MLDDFNTAENVYLRQRNQVNNTKVHIAFYKNQDYIDQIDKLFQCLEFGDYKKEINVVNIFTDNHQDDQNEETLVFDESKTGKTIYTLILDLSMCYLKHEDEFRLINFTVYCPNLISLHVIIRKISTENLIELCKNISIHLSQLREIQFEMQEPIIYPKKELEITNYISNIKTLQSIIFNFNLSQLSIEDWKLVYSQFSKLKKLNTLNLTSKALSYQVINSQQKQIAYTYHKKLLRLVTKSISIYPIKQEVYNYDDDIDIEINLFD